MFGTGLQIVQAELICKLTGLVVGDCPLGCHVALVAHKHPVDARLRILFNLLQPMAYVVKGLAVCEVEGHDDAMCASVVAGANGAKSLLAGGVPNLRLGLLAIQEHGPDTEVDADGGNKVVGVGVV